MCTGANRCCPDSMLPRPPPGFVHTSVLSARSRARPRTVPRNRTELRFVLHGEQSPCDVGAGAASTGASPAAAQPAMAPAVQAPPPAPAPTQPKAKASSIWDLLGPRRRARKQGQATTRPTPPPSYPRVGYAGFLVLRWFQGKDCTRFGFFMQSVPRV